MAMTRASVEEPDLGEEASVADAGCTRCHGRLVFVGRKDFHEGTRAWRFIQGDLGELFTSGTQLAMWACEPCGQVESFLPEES